MELEELKDQMRSIGESGVFFGGISWWFTCWILLVCAVMIDLDYHRLIIDWWYFFKYHQNSWTFWNFKSRVIRMFPDFSFEGPTYSVEVRLEKQIFRIVFLSGTDRDSEKEAINSLRHQLRRNRWFSRPAEFWGLLVDLGVACTMTPNSSSCWAIQSIWHHTLLQTKILQTKA